MRSVLAKDTVSAVWTRGLLRSRRQRSQVAAWCPTRWRLPAVRSVVAKDTVSYGEAREWDRRVGDGCRVRLWRRSLRDGHFLGRHSVDDAFPCSCWAALQLLFELPRCFRLRVLGIAHSARPLICGTLVSEIKIFKIVAADTMLWHPDRDSKNPQTSPEHPHKCGHERFACEMPPAHEGLPNASWVQRTADHSKLLLLPAEMRRGTSPLMLKARIDFRCDYDRQATLPWTWRHCKHLVTCCRCRNQISICQCASRRKMPSIGRLQRELHVSWKAAPLKYTLEWKN